MAVNTTVARSAFQLVRRRATHSRSRPSPSTASRYAWGSSATAECRNVPYGTCTAKSSALKAKSVIAYTIHGEKFGSRRRSHAPMSVNGTRKPSSGMVAKIVSADVSPATRLDSKGPRPWARKVWSVVTLLTL